MDRPVVTEDDLRREHAAMQIVTPFDALSEAVRRALAAAAGARAKRTQSRVLRAPVDLKRRAAGDFDD